MRQIYNDNTKKPKPKENQLGILKIYAFWPNSAEDLGSRRALMVLRIYENAPKNCRIFPLKVVTTLLSGSRKDATGV